MVGSRQTAEGGYGQKNADFQRFDRQATIMSAVLTSVMISSVTVAHFRKPLFSRSWKDGITVGGRKVAVDISPGAE